MGRSVAVCQKPTRVTNVHLVAPVHVEAVQVAHPVRKKDTYPLPDTAGSAGTASVSESLPAVAFSGTMLSGGVTKPTSNASGAGAVRSLGIDHVTVKVWSAFNTQLPDTGVALRATSWSSAKSIAIPSGSVTWWNATEPTWMYSSNVRRTTSPPTAMKWAGSAACSGAGRDLELALVKLDNDPTRLIPAADHQDRGDRCGCGPRSPGGRPRTHRLLNELEREPECGADDDHEEDDRDHASGHAIAMPGRREGSVVSSKSAVARSSLTRFCSPPYGWWSSQLCRRSGSSRSPSEADETGDSIGRCTRYGSPLAATQADRSSLRATITIAHIFDS